MKVPIPEKRVIGFLKIITDTQIKTALFNVLTTLCVTGDMASIRAMPDMVWKWKPEKMFCFIIIFLFFSKIIFYVFKSYKCRWRGRLLPFDQSCLRILLGLQIKKALVFERRLRQFQCDIVFLLDCNSHFENSGFFLIAHFANWNQNWAKSIYYHFLLCF